MLAVYAEDHIEETNPPLFLRFINLLINDAIFLLDEAIQVSLFSSNNEMKLGPYINSRAAYFKGTFHEMPPSNLK